MSRNSNPVRYRVTMTEYPYQVHQFGQKHRAMNFAKESGVRCEIWDQDETRPNTVNFWYCIDGNIIAAGRTPKEGLPL